MDEKIYVNWFYHIEGVGRKGIDKILKGGLLPNEIYALSSAELEKYLKNICFFTEKDARKILVGFLKLKKEKSAENIWTKLKSCGIEMYLQSDVGYPARLKEIVDAPAVLYVKGDVSRMNEAWVNRPSVAVIGARDCSQYGKAVAAEIGKECALRGINLVSGMARGVDGIAQEAALKEGGIVAAVLGSGVDVCYPASNSRLYQEILQKGAVYSEYVPGTLAKANHFPPRNRIISGMADKVIVVEAKEKSGTLITVDMALEQGRDVCAVPGRITDAMSKGCHRLICQGADILYNIEETLSQIAPYKRKKEDKEISWGKEQENTLRKKILKILDFKPRTVQVIYEKVKEEQRGENVDFSELIEELFYMQTEGLIFEVGGRFFVDTL